MIDQIYAAPKGVSLEEGFQFANEHRLNFELPNFYEPANLERLDEEIARTARLLTDFNGTLALHGPIMDVNVVSPDPEVRRISRHRYQQAIIAAKQLGVRYIVFHTQWSPIFQVAGLTKGWLAEVTDYWEQIIAEHLEETAITVLIENFMDEKPDLMNTVLSRIDSPHLKACLDTGHVNLFSEMSPIDWMSELGNHLVYIHAHNNNGESDEHEAFDKGLIDMESFLNHLALLPQKIHLAIEVGNISALARSYEMLKPYLQLQTEQFASKSFLI